MTCLADKECVMARRIMYPIWSINRLGEVVRINGQAELFRFATSECGLSQGFIKAAEEEELLEFIRVKFGLQNNPPPPVR